MEGAGSGGCQSGEAAMYGTDPEAASSPDHPQHDSLRMLWPQDELYDTIVQVHFTWVACPCTSP